MEYIAEILGAFALTMVGWLHTRQGKLEDQLNQFVKKDSFEELRVDLKDTLELLTELRVENARWQGLMERAIENDSKRS